MHRVHCGKRMDYRYCGYAIRSCIVSASSKDTFSNYVALTYEQWKVPRYIHGLDYSAWGTEG